MYESHFGLTGPPFQVTPDPSFVFHGKAYRGAIEALREGLATGVKAMIVTHEMGFARRVADRVIFMDEGKVVESSVPADFFDRPQSSRLRAFLGQVLAH